MSHPKNISDHAWFYEEVDGLKVVHEIYDGDKFLRTETLNIPWRKLISVRHPVYNWKRYLFRCPRCGTAHRLLTRINGPHRVARCRGCSRRFWFQKHRTTAKTRMTDPHKRKKPKVVSEAKKFSKVVRKLMREGVPKPPVGYREPEIKKAKKGSPLFKLLS